MRSKTSIYTFASLFLIIIIDTMGFGIVMPILPPLFLNTQTSLLPVTISVHLRDFYYGLTMAMFFVFALWGAPCMGDLSDQFGRKKVMFYCLLMVSLGYFVSALGILDKSIGLLILGRAVCGFAAGSQPIAQAAIIDISNPRNKALNIGLISFAFCIGFIIGPIMGGYFSTFLMTGPLGYTIPFFVAGSLAIINSICLLLTFKETYQPPQKKSFNLMKAITSFKVIFSLKQLHFLAVIYLLIQYSWSVYFQFITLYMTQVFHYSANQNGLFMAYLGVIFSISVTVIVRVLLNYMNHRTLILFSLMLVMLGAVFTSVFKTPLGHWLSLLPIAIGMALTITILMTVFSDRVSQDSQGVVMGIMSALSSIAWVFGGMSIGLFTLFGLNFPFLMSALLVLVSSLLILMDSKKYAY